MTRDKFKQFLEDALRGDSWTEQDIFIEDSKLDIVADKYEALTNKGKVMNNAPIITINKGAALNLRDCFEELALVSEWRNSR